MLPTVGLLRLGKAQTGARSLHEVCIDRSFTTYEYIESVELMVRKEDGRSIDRVAYVRSVQVYTEVSRRIVDGS